MSNKCTLIPRSGRPRVTSRRQDRAIRFSHLHNRHQTASPQLSLLPLALVITRSPRNCEKSTAHAGIRARRPYVGPPFNSRTSLALYGVDDGTCPKKISNEVVKTDPFTDESRCTFFAQMVKITLTTSCGNASPTLGLLRGSDLVWGSISHNVKSQLIVIACNLTTVRHRDEVLRIFDVPLVQ